MPSIVANSAEVKPSLVPKSFHFEQCLLSLSQMGQNSASTILVPCDVDTARMGTIIGGTASILVKLLADELSRRDIVNFEMKFDY